jgi:hypothetical protein
VTRRTNLDVHVAMVAQIVKSSVFKVGPIHSGLGPDLLVVAMKGVVAIDPLVISVGPESNQMCQRKYSNFICVCSKASNTYHLDDIDLCICNVVVYRYLTYP